MSIAQRLRALPPKSEQGMQNSKRANYQLDYASRTGRHDRPDPPPMHLGWRRRACRRHRNPWGIARVNGAGAGTFGTAWVIDTASTSPSELNVEPGA